LKRLGFYGLAISIDHTNSEIHNGIRKRKDAFELAVRGIEACTKNGIVLQVNVTAMEYNLDDIENILKFADKMRAAIVLNYQLVEVGRGSVIKDKSVNPENNQELMNNLLRWQKDITPIIEPVASPQYWPNLLIQKGATSEKQINFYKNFFHGCTAGIGLAYIKPNGDVWPCPFVEVSAGNVKEKPFHEIWRHSELFLKLRERKNYEGDCGACKFNSICGGCRGKAWATTGNCLAEDSTCFISKDIKFNEI
jgi:radical SAM protein with 4Fe4S-binding SPASM domain